MDTTASVRQKQLHCERAEIATVSLLQHKTKHIMLQRISLICYSII